MKFYRNLLFGVVDALNDILIENKYADQVIQNLTKQNKKWGSKDRKFVAQLSYDITRFYRYYFYIANVELLEVHKSDLWNVIAAYIIEKNHDLPSFEEFQTINTEKFQKRIGQANSIFTIKESVPDWFNDFGEKSLGKELWQKEISELNRQAQVVLRVNTLAIPKQEQENPIDFVQDALAKENIETITLKNYPEALQLVQRKNIMHTKAYKNGWVEIQDASSQLVAPFTQAKPNQFVVDACSGAGGKTIHLAKQMNNQGEIKALEVIEWKLRELNKRARRAKATIIETHLPKLSILNKLQTKADVVLIDAPCSGLGTIKRKADLKLKITPNFINEMVELQADILKQYSSLVKKGGILVYSTCSILPQENKNQIEKFLKTELGSEFLLEEEKQVYSNESGYDGFYMARLKRIENS